VRRWGKGAAMENDYALHATIGGLSVLLAVLAWFADRRRMRRADPDKVGFMPWTGLFFWSLMAAIVLLAFAAREWLAA
jgi:hypothetical protein